MRFGLFVATICDVHVDSNEEFGLENAETVIHLDVIAIATELLHQPTLHKLMLLVRKHVHGVDLRLGGGEKKGLKV